MSITTLDPQSIWQYFYQITQIPRPSHHEEGIQTYILAEAHRLGFVAEKDAAHNILIRKPASLGYEKHPGIILQGHLDMVAQKNSDSTHNFLTDPIQTYIDEGWVYADGTTLGADNGIGVACALAVLADKQIQHGPLEILLTATEETGMLGAKGLQQDWLTGSYLINLDSEALGEICIGCAGGVDADFRLPITLDNALTTDNAFTIELQGLRGGHSGVDIDKQRGNAICLMAELLHQAQTSADIKIAELAGGNLRNAIPREATATISTPYNQAVISEQLDAILTEIRAGLPKEDHGLIIKIKPVTPPSKVWSTPSQNIILNVLQVFPNGVDRMSVDQPGVVETSVNLSTLETENDQIHMQALIRSLRDSARDNLASKLATLFSLADGRSEFTNHYSSWQPDLENPLNLIVTEAGQFVLNSPPKITVIHAGLECGLIAEKYPKIKMISFGPNIEMPHSPDERVEIQSVKIFWQWLKKVLSQL